MSTVQKQYYILHTTYCNYSHTTYCILYTAYYMLQYYMYDIRHTTYCAVLDIKVLGWLPEWLPFGCPNVLVARGTILVAQT